VGTEKIESEHLNEWLLALAYDLGVATDFQGALDVLLDRLCALLPADGVSVMWLGGDHLEVLAQRGPTAPLRGLTLPIGQVGAARSVLDGGRASVVLDTVKDMHWQQIPGEEQVRSWLAAPLLVDETNLGLLEWTSLEAARFSQEDATTAIRVAHSVAPILHRSQLLDDARRRLRERMESEMVTGRQTLDLRTELEPVVAEALEFTGAQHAFLFLHDKDMGGLRCVAARGRKRDEIATLSLRGDGTLGGWSIPLGGIYNWPTTGLSDQETMASIGLDRTLILPLRVSGSPVGMMGVAQPRKGRVFGRDAIRLMTHLSSQASVVVERLQRNASTMDSHDYKSAFNSSPLGVGLIAITGELELCNPALVALLSRTDRTLLGRNLAEFLVPSDGRRILRAMEEVAITEQHRQVDVRLQSTSGEYRHIRVSLSLAEASNEPGRDTLVVIMEDITSLKILERERVEHLRQLREKHAQLEELDQLKSRFVSNVSHELRTPLAVIKLYATLTRKGRPEKQMHYLQTIEQETHRLETMVENILDLTRMDRQSLRVSPELLAAEEIIAQVLQVYEETAQKRAVELRNHVRGELPLLWADKNHLIQMLTNLVDNALKYTPRGGQVWVAAREIDIDSKHMLEIAVGDTGLGIEEDEQAKVFERFYRGSNNTSSSTGTGLGLAIVQELMMHHGGRVTLNSRAGEGSVFTLQFPLYEDGAPLAGAEEEDD
jgi:PAS domain S-box-containing protein